MKTNNRIPYMDVIVTTKDMCEYLTGVEHTVLYSPIKLKDKGVIKQYLSVVICKTEDMIPAQIDIFKNDSIPKEEYKVSKEYCHITTYEPNIIDQKEISFDENDDYPIKAEFSEEYKIIEDFFKNFIKMRNKLIEEKQIVKDDDINQYFQSLTGFTKNNKKKLSRK